MEKTVIQTNLAPSAIGPYSQGIKYGSLIFISGQIPLNQEGKLAGEEIDLQARQTLENLKAILEAANSSLEKVLKTTIFLKNLADFNLVNQIYAEYFKENYPSRSTVQVADLPKGAKIEIEAIASI
ncbi:MAG: RidA family protein [Armatimonadetes bacterium]|nr:RidA family protein [Armatimonadota bacterium]